MLLFGVIEISRLNVAKPCYLSKMSGEGNRFFSFFFFAVSFVRVFCGGVCHLPVCVSVTSF